MSDSVNVQLIRLEKLKPFKNYPFTVRDNEQLRCIADSVRSVGIETPARSFNNAPGVFFPFFSLDFGACTVTGE